MLGGLLKLLGTFGVVLLALTIHDHSIAYWVAVVQRLVH